MNQKLKFPLSMAVYFIYAVKQEHVFIALNNEKQRLLLLVIYILLLPHS